MDKWVSQCFESKTNLVSNKEIAEILWSIWKSRNALVFNSRWPNPNRAIDLPLTEQAAFLRWNPRPTNKDEIQSHLPLNWVSPARGELKINVDGSKLEGTVDAAVVGVARDHGGVLIHGFALSVQAGSAEACETLALLHALRFVEEKLGSIFSQNGKVEVQTDCTSLVRCLLNGEKDPWETWALVEECNAKLAQLDFVKLRMSMGQVGFS
ncbi:hypothetical protein NL676_039312 [Syzygium grande]|nr:hypothetical protein NL676_039312 [Syzygium grande]